MWLGVLVVVALCWQMTLNLVVPAVIAHDSDANYLYLKQPLLEAAIGAAPKSPHRFDLSLDLADDKQWDDYKNAILSIEDLLPLVIKCEVKLVITTTSPPKKRSSNDSSSTFLWLHNGSPLDRVNNTYRTVATNVSPDETRLSSSINFAHFAKSDEGLYECSAKTENGVRKSSKLKIALYHEWNITELALEDELVCEPRLYANYCKNRGLCTYHRKTKIMGCICQENFNGPFCEYPVINADIETRVGPSCEPCSQTNSTLIVLITVTWCAIVMLIFSVVLLVIARKRCYLCEDSLFHRKNRHQNHQSVIRNNISGHEKIELIEILQHYPTGSMNRTARSTGMEQQDTSIIVLPTLFLFLILAFELASLYICFVFRKYFRLEQTGSRSYRTVF